MRDAKEIFSGLKDNVDQIMANLQDGLMLFTGDARVVLVSASVERFLGRPRGDLLGRTVKEIFSPDSVFGLAVLEGFRQRTAVMQREFESPNGKRVQVSRDRKSTRLNSSHQIISYAVFCLKKKKRLKK